MADPANIDTSTPDPKIAEGGVDRQKALLNELIAMEGQNGRRIYERQGPEAQQLLQARLGDAGSMPDARKQVYGTFVQDQLAAENQHQRQLQRQSALNSQFMDAAKAAVPIHSKNVDAAIDAMRLQFEERQRREAEAAAERAAAASRSAAANVNPLIKTHQQQQEYLAWLEANGGLPAGEDVTLSMAEQMGKSGARLTVQDAAKAIGVTYDQFIKDNDVIDINVAQGALDKYVKDQKGEVSLADFKAQVNTEAEAFGLSPLAIQLLIAANAPRWATEPRKSLDNDIYEPALFEHGAAVRASELGAPGYGGVPAAPQAPPSTSSNSKTGTGSANATKKLGQVEKIKKLFHL